MLFLNFIKEEETISAPFLGLKTGTFTGVGPETGKCVSSGLELLRI